MAINYCQKCGQVMECVITYQCGLPRIKFFCPHHGTAIEYQVMYSTSTSGADMKEEQMSRYIDAEHFDERVRLAGGMSEDELTEDFKDGVLATLVLLSTEPTADVVEVVHGEWIDKGHYRYCSVCNYNNPHIYNYCPNCGAKMDS